MKTPTPRFVAFIAAVFLWISPWVYRSAHSAVSEDAATFQGHYLWAFEVSSFVPCGMQVKPGYGKGYWLDTNSDFFRKYEAVFAKQRKNLGNEVVFARFEGKLAPKAEGFSGYGHLGAYARELKVIKLLEVRFPTDEDCK